MGKSSCWYLFPIFYPIHSQSYGFPSSHVQMWELDHKESWVLKNWCFWTVVLEKILESPLDSKEIKPVNPKGNQPWIFIERADAEALILWPPDAKSWLIGKDPDAGEDWRQKEKGVTEDEMVRWHHWLNGREFEQAEWWWRTEETGELQSKGFQRVGTCLWNRTIAATRGLDWCRYIFLLHREIFKNAQWSSSDPRCSRLGVWGPFRRL